MLKHESGARLTTAFLALIAAALAVGCPGPVPVAPTYVVTYDANGADEGEVPSDGNEYLAGDSAVVLGNTGNLVKLGYAFSGWGSAPGAVAAEYGAGDAMVIGAADATLYAVWGDYSYAVSFDGQGSDAAISPASVTVASPAYTIGASNMPAEPTKDRYYFSGWYTRAGGQGERVTANSRITGDVVLYAYWTDKPVYDVVFDPRNGTAEADFYTVSVIEGGCVGADDFPEDPAYAGYHFAGWNSSSGGTGDAFDEDSIVTGDRTIYAVWNSHSYVVTFDGQGATTPASPATMTVASPEVTVGTLPADPLRSGYAFRGWYTGTGGQGMRFTGSTALSASVTVFAYWEDVAPAAPDFYVAKAGNGRIDLAWTEPEEADYHHTVISWGAGQQATVAAGTSSYSLTGLTTGSEYSFAAVAYDAAGHASAPTSRSITLYDATLRTVRYVSSPAELAAMQNDLDAYYLLAGDIDMSEYDTWSPVGVNATSDDDYARQFSGILDGKGFIISGLHGERGLLHISIRLSSSTSLWRTRQYRNIAYFAALPPPRSSGTAGLPEPSSAVPPAAVS